METGRECRRRRKRTGTEKGQEMAKEGERQWACVENWRTLCNRWVQACAVVAKEKEGSSMFFAQSSPFHRHKQMHHTHFLHACCCSSGRGQVQGAAGGRGGPLALLHVLPQLPAAWLMHTAQAKLRDCNAHAGLGGKGRGAAPGGPKALGGASTVKAFLSQC